MESSIAEHLQVPRSRPPRKSSDYTPPYPATSARFRPQVTQVVMAYLGVQYRGEAPADVLAGLRGTFTAADGPGGVDRARYVDEAGWTTDLHIAYWDDPAAYDRWTAAGVGWTDPSRAGQGVGLFAEVLRPSVQRYETLFSNDRLEGVSVLAEGLSGEIREHGYWGGARDRMPLAQVDALAPGSPPRVVRDGPVLRVTPQENLCLIRSGQEWTETDGDERRMYTEDVEPELRAGMDFLRDDGLGVGCYANRYVRVLDDDGRLTDKSFGMSWWRSMEELDTWAESHPTHLAIFGAAMRYLTAMGPAARLRLYHEVTVAAADEQSFSYLDCHPATGMLRAAVTTG